MSKTAQQIVQQQLDAYNDQDLEAFTVCYSETIVISDFPGNEANIKIKGIKELKTFYKDVFENSPQLQCHIANRIVFDNKVIDHEQIKGRKGTDGLLEVIAVYEIENELIERVMFIRKKTV